MSQLIALIIAIALGAIVTAIGYVFLGDAFTKNSERGVALQFVNQASQVEMAMVASRAESAKSAFVTGTTPVLAWENTSDALAASGHLKTGVTAPQGDYTMFQDADKNTFLVVDATTSVLSAAVCGQINKLAGTNISGVGYVPAAAADFAAADTALNGARYGCFTGGTGFLFAYEVE